MPHPLFLQRMGLIPSGAASFQPAFSNVKWLWDFKDIINSPTEEITGNTITNSGCTISTSQKHFNNNTTFFGSGDHISNVGTNPQEALMRFSAAGDFVLEGWVRHSGAFTTNRMIGAVYRSGIGQRVWQLRILGDSHGTNPGQLRWTGFTDGDSGASGYSLDGPVVTKGEWVHWALQRKGTEHIIFVNGSPGTALITSNRPDDIGNDMVEWGQDHDGNFQFNGYMSDHRVTNGEAFYPSAGFDQPAAVWPRS